MRLGNPAHYDAAQSAAILAMKALDGLTDEEARAAVDEAARRHTSHTPEQPKQPKRRNHTPANPELPADFI